MLLGVTLVTNGVKLGYPFEACIRNLSACCDFVTVNTDDLANEDDTTNILHNLEDELGNIYVFHNRWDWSVNNGTDLAAQVNYMLDHAMEGRHIDMRELLDNHNSVLYVQADEIVSPVEINRLKKSYCLTNTNLFLERTYFWKDINHINRSWTMRLPRMCPLTPRLRVIEDGMSMKIDDTFYSMNPPVDTARIYHYSRVGDTDKIADRLNVLDSLFHKKDSYSPLDKYEFGKNNNFESGADTSVIEEFKGKHPDFIEDFYCSKEEELK
jgi:hypothetical protein